MAQHFDLAIIGTGSGNSLVTPELEDKKVALIEGGTFGGTCLNVGCIPTKMFVYAADLAQAVTTSGRFGIDATLDGVRWKDIRDRIFGRIDPISRSGQDYRVHGANTTAFLGHARFTGPRSLEVSTGDTLTADQVVIAAGGHPVVPEVVARSGVPFHTSDTVMRIEDLPARMVILGGGYIGLVVRGNRLLRHLDSEVSDRFTEIACGRWDVRLGTEVVAATGDDLAVRLDLSDGSTVDTDLLLVATGRVPNTRDLGLEVAGIATHADGRVAVDCHGRTNVDGVWALGDVSSPYQLKHVANHEARVVAHNLVHPESLREVDHRYVPAAVFTYPQIASVGSTEDQVRAQRVPYICATQAYGDTAYGWAMEDTTGICKLVADPRTGRLLGAHLMGPQASSLIQPLIQGISFGQTVREMARGQYWIHPALAEVVENALLKLELASAEDLTTYPSTP